MPIFQEDNAIGYFYFLILVITWLPSDNTYECDVSRINGEAWTLDPLFARGDEIN